LVVKRLELGMDSLLLYIAGSYTKLKSTLSDRLTFGDKMELTYT